MISSLLPSASTRLLKAALGVAAVAALVPAAAQAHPGHYGHPGAPDATPIVEIPFPAMGPSAGGYSSSNVEFVKNIPLHADTAGARKLGNFFYITTERDLTIYDVSKPLEPVQLGRLTLPEIGQPVFTEEDPDTNGRILLVSNGGILMVIDVTDKKAPKLLSQLEDADDHTVSCVLDCTWAYGSEGTIVDLRDPKKPVLSKNNWKTSDIESEHDVTEVSPGIVLTSTQPLKLLDARTTPDKPTVLASTQKQPGRFVHANLWPRNGTDDFMLVGGEAVGPDCSESVSATFSTWDARTFMSTGTTKQLDEFRLKPGLVTEGRAPESSFCVHWFDEHPYYANGGIVAIGWYEHGTHFLQIGKDGKIKEIGWFLGGGGQSSAAYWIDERTVYVADYIRGLDILKFTGEIGSPPAPTTTGGGTTGGTNSTTGTTGGEQQAAAKDQPAKQPAAAANAGRSAQSSPANTAKSVAPDTSCSAPTGFSSASVRSSAGRLTLAFGRTTQAPVTVDVFQQSVGRRVVGERLVARFTGRGGNVKWNGKANRRGRTVSDGIYSVRYRTKTASGVDTRRVALRRANGRWTARPTFYRRSACDLLPSFKLERPVFGGSTNRALGITYQVERQAQVTVSVLRGTKVVKRFATQSADPKRTYRLRFGAKGASRGDYRVRIEARREGERVMSTAVSHRL